MSDRRMKVDRRIHDNLRKMVDDACAGAEPHIAKCIRDVARRAYYLGCMDGMQLQRDKDREAKK